MPLEIDERDIKVEFFRASGPGGQHRNTTDSGVRIRHLPTGIVVQATEHRSQLRNREVAMERLRQALARLMQKRKKRVATKVPQGEKIRRLEQKRLTSLRRRQRSIEE